MLHLCKAWRAWFLIHVINRTNQQIAFARDQSKQLLIEASRRATSLNPELQLWGRVQVQGWKKPHSTRECRQKASAVLLSLSAVCYLPLGELKRVFWHFYLKSLCVVEMHSFSPPRVWKWHQTNCWMWRFWSGEPGMLKVSLLTK